MKLQLLATSLVLAAVVSTPASAMVSKQSLNKAIHSSISSGSLSSVINGDTVTLFGTVESTYEENKARQAALNIDGVNRVISRVNTSN